jgi:nucleoside-diphosphate-sugar epimerase
MNILVTGCAGFIGWKVTEFLLKEGCKVVGVDNLNDAYDVRLKRWRLAQLEGKPGFSFYQIDIVNRGELRELWESRRTEPFTAVINLAARAGVRQSVENPWVYYETNVIGTLNLLELCREFGVKKFVLASTSSLYGASNPRPFREDANTDEPLSPYAASKKAAEVLCYTYHYLYGIDVIVLRYFTVYGPAGRPDMSIFRFIHWIAEGKPVVLYGDGFQERDFTFVDDIAQGTIYALAFLNDATSGSGLATRGSKFEIINLGSDRPVSVKQVIVLLEELVGRKAEVAYLPKHPADMSATWADISKARQILKWEPKISLEEGLRFSVKWYIENQSWVRKINL